MDPFEFYSQVYGLENVIMPGAVVPASATSWLVFTSSLSAEEFQSHREMFYKITAAMGLKEKEFTLRLQNSDLPISSVPIVQVSFGGATVGWGDSGGAKVLTVPSLEDMSQHPELKKTAWTLLKQSLDFRPAF